MHEGKLKSDDCKSHWYEKQTKEKFVEFLMRKDEEEVGEFTYNQKTSSLMYKTLFLNQMQTFPDAELRVFD